MSPYPGSHQVRTTAVMREKWNVSHYQEQEIKRKWSSDNGRSVREAKDDGNAHSIGIAHVEKKYFHRFTCRSSLMVMGDCE